MIHAGQTYSTEHGPREGLRAEHAARWGQGHADRRAQRRLADAGAGARVTAQWRLLALRGGLRRAGSLGAALMLALACILAGPAGPTLAQPAPPAFGSGSDAAAAAAALAGRLLAADTTDEDAAAAVAQAFAWAGIETRSAADLDLVLGGAAPTIPVHVLDTEAHFLANDARARAAGGYRLTLAELGAALEEAGWGLPAGQSPGAALVRVLAEAIREAAAQPASTHSFTPLFLRAMSAGANPPVDLAGGQADPAAVRLSLLEGQLLLAAHLRGTQPYPAAPAALGGVAEDALAVMAVSAARSYLAHVVLGHSHTPCGDFENNIKELGRQLGVPGLAGMIQDAHLVAVDMVTSVPFDKLYDKLGIAKDGWGPAQRVALGEVLNVLKTISAVGVINFHLDVDEEIAPGKTVHYGRDGQRNQAWFRARAWAPDLRRAEGGEALRDCLNVLGFDVPEDVVGQLKDARVVWDWRGIAPHGTVSLESGNQFDQHAPPSTVLGEDGFALLVVDLEEEDKGAHEEGGLRRGAMYVEAQLDTSSFPGYGPLFKAVFGDAPGAVVDLLGGWYKAWFGPRAGATVAVTWHEPCPPQTTVRSVGANDRICVPLGWRGTITAELVREVKADGTETRDLGSMGSTTVTTYEESYRELHTFTVTGPAQPNSYGATDAGTLTSTISGRAVERAVATIRGYCDEYHGRQRPFTAERVTTREHEVVNRQTPDAPASVVREGVPMGVVVRDDEWSVAVGFAFDRAFGPVPFTVRTNDRETHSGSCGRPGGNLTHTSEGAEHPEFRIVNLPNQIDWGRLNDPANPNVINATWTENRAVRPFTDKDLRGMNVTVAKQTLTISVNLTGTALPPP
jgi:hypothetical protein